MKIRILAVGALSNPHLKALCEDYARRIPRLAPFEILEVKDGKAQLGDKRLITEAETLRRKGEAGAEGPLSGWAAWDAVGETLSSEALAAWLSQREKENTRVLTWVIGSSHGLDSAFKKSCDFRLSLGPMTFTHEMARFLVLEQLYRALSIQRHLPYHH